MGASIHGTPDDRRTRPDARFDVNPQDLLERPEPPPNRIIRDGEGTGGLVLFVLGLTIGMLAGAAAMSMVLAQ